MHGLEDMTLEQLARTWFQNQLQHAIIVRNIRRNKKRPLAEGQLEKISYGNCIQNFAPLQ